MNCLPKIFLSSIRHGAIVTLLVLGMATLTSPLAGGDRAGRRFDIIIRGGTVIDGTGGARRPADVGIIGDTVWAVGDLSECSAGQEISASNRLVTPGFIDMHAHVADGRMARTACSPRIASAARRRISSCRASLPGPATRTATKLSPCSSKGAS